ncbi:putative permease [Herminiimonas arsenicoxydans]|uniref:Permease n=1 Tax=Herminiimonas arsenicoxydans TaxID=204773 RepID=A4G7P3_HERAR|nr:putative permease [Herminiimonas arsenicoxydans]
MKILQKYFAAEIGRSVIFVLIAFLALFGFFDLIAELKAVGHGGYKIQHALLFVLLSMPGYLYELMPIAALIGTIWTLSQFAARSEFTIMRASSMSTGMAGLMLIKIGLVFAIVTFVVGEFVVPASSNMAEKIRTLNQGGSLSQEFRSGLWTKDMIRSNGKDGEAIGSRFLNVRTVQPDGQLTDLKIYEFNRNFHLTALITAARADYQGDNVWLLSNGSQAEFGETELMGAAVATDITTAISTRNFASKPLISEVTPEILSVGFSDPAKMSAYDLVNYTQYLAENNRETARYEIALWKKVVYPFAVFVMMALALPFAYLHFRSGGVSLKIFTGIMIGVSFQLINSLFSHLGLLNTWPPFATAILPSLLFLLAAIGALLWVERH